MSSVNSGNPPIQLLAAGPEDSCSHSVLCNTVGPVESATRQEDPRCALDPSAPWANPSVVLGSGLRILSRGSTRISLIVVKMAKETVWRFQPKNPNSPTKDKRIGSLDNINFVRVRRVTK